MPRVPSAEVTVEEGERVLTFSNAYITNDNGEITGTLSAALDMTDKMMLERQLMEAQKMEYIAALAGGVAHNINNALMIIMG